MFFVLFILILLVACNKDEAEQTTNDTKNSGSDKVESKVIDIYNNKEENIGTAELSEVAKGVVIELKADGLPPGLQLRSPPPRPHR